jgi:hypothetical protein
MRGWMTYIHPGNPCAASTNESDRNTEASRVETPTSAYSLVSFSVAELTHFTTFAAWDYSTNNLSTTICDPKWPA